MAAAKPQLSPLAARSAVTLVAMAAAACGAGTSAEAPRPPAERRAALPPEVARYVHGTFHRFPRFCARGRTDRGRLDEVTGRFVELYRRYPSDRFEMTIDGESGTMLSAILVLRDELSRCSPGHAARIDPALPPRIRRALRPLPAARG